MQRLQQLRDLRTELERRENERLSRLRAKLARWDTPGDLAKAINPSMVQTPALDVVDQELVWAHTTRGARLIVSMPPQEGKSERVTKTGSLWALTRNPELRLGIVSYSQALAEGFGRDVRNWISSNNGDEGTLDLGLRIARDNGSARRWQLDGHRGGIVCVGIGGGLTGRPLDCVTGDSTIITPEGLVTVADLVRAPSLPLVLSWNHDSQRAEWRQVEATRTIPGREVVEVRTAFGRRIRCTPDHRIYADGRGYVPAAELRPGDRLVAADEGPRAVQRLRCDRDPSQVDGAPGDAGRGTVLLEGVQGRSGTRATDVRGLRDAVQPAPVRGRQVRPTGLGSVVLLEGVLRRGGEQAACREEAVCCVRCPEADDAGSVLFRRMSGAVLRRVRGLRALWDRLRDASVRVGEEAQGAAPGLLLTGLYGGRIRDTDERDLPGLRSEDAAQQRPEVLYAGVPGCPPHADAVAPRPGVHGVRIDLPAEVEPDHVLLAEVCEFGACSADGGRRELAVSDRDELCGLVPEDASADHLAGWRSVRRVPHLPAANAVPPQGGPDDAHLPTCAPHRRVPGEQRAGESGDALQELSLGAPQVEYDTVSVVEHIRGERHTVYDLQVEGNCNFFADEVLVHNCLIIDDPFADKEQAASAYYRERVWSWWQAVGSTRLAPGAPVIVILTRWHEDDIAGRFLAAEDADRWRVVNIPALADHDPNKGESDPLGRAPGEWLISARGRTVAEWEEIRIQAGSRVFNALYQGRPSPDAGNVWRRPWWRRYSVPLWSQHPTLPDAYVVDECDEMVMSWDMAFKDTKSSDYVVGQVWARRGANVYLLDQVHKRLSFTDTVTAFQGMVARWPQATRKLVEDKANGTAIIDTLRSKIPGIVAVTPTESKYARANAVAPVVEAGNVLLPEAGIALFDPESLIDEAAAFPNGAHDDQVDATSQALAQMMLDGTGAQAWIDYVRRKVEANAAAAQQAAAQTTQPEPTPNEDPAEARRRARQAAYRQQYR